MKEEVKSGLLRLRWRSTCSSSSSSSSSSEHKFWGAAQRGMNG